MTEVPVTGAVIKWAREFRGLTIEQAAEKFGWSTEELRAYEDDKRKPDLGKFEKFSDIYRLPQATLFLRTRPSVPPMPRDFRTRGGARPRVSFEFNVAVSNVRTLQRTLSILRSEDEDFLVADLPSYTRRGDPWAQGEQERGRLGITVDQQLHWRAKDAFRRWRALIEQTGVSVYLEKFEEDDCLGYSLLDGDSPPAIVINKTDEFENARIYTLIHEYAHLLIGEPGISDLDYRNPVEAFCNKFAAGFLMPRTALRAVLPAWPNEPRNWERNVIQWGAARLKVSQRAFALRLEELEMAPRGFNKRFAWRPARDPRVPSGGGNYVATRLSELGGHYTSAVIGALDRRVINTAQAAEALGLAPANFESARAYRDRQRDLASGK